MTTRQQPRKPARHRAPKRVAVLVDTSTSWGRRIHEGIHHYAQKHGRWQLFVEARGMEERLALPRGWHGDGVIARVSTQNMAHELSGLDIPVVNVSGIQLQGAEFPQVTSDLVASAKIAADHFLARGFRSFAYFSLHGLEYVAKHQQAFSESVSKSGFTCAVLAVNPVKGAEPDWNLDLAKLGTWLKTLPKPVAVLTWNPSSAREIIFASQAANLLVPEDVAVLSSSDDHLLCRLLDVDISALSVAAETIGFEAARILDRLMCGQEGPKKPILIPPVGVVTRQSTDTLAISDRAVVKAVSFIRENLSQPLHVAEIARHAGVSRRVLERRFHLHLGRSPAEEIRRARLRKAQELLLNTDMPVPELSEAAGFGSPEYMAYVFRKECNTTPVEYRRRVSGTNV
jgi:LacI family transcriptional regulator, galactose operon repressor